MTKPARVVAEFKHCDEYIDDYEQPDCLRWFLLIERLSASLKFLADRMGVAPKLFADYGEQRVRVVMASRMGDLGITSNLNEETGYERRVAVAALSNFSPTP